MCTTYQRPGRSKGLSGGTSSSSSSSSSELPVGVLAGRLELDDLHDLVDDGAVRVEHVDHVDRDGVLGAVRVDDVDDLDRLDDLADHDALGVDDVGGRRHGLDELDVAGRVVRRDGVGPLPVGHFW